MERRREIDELDPDEAQELENQRTREAQTRRPMTAQERQMVRIREAQEIYHIADQCLEKGDLDKAYTCYHEVVRMCPASDYARLARRHIQRIDLLRQLDVEFQDVTASSSTSVERTNQPCCEEAENGSGEMQWSDVVQSFFPGSNVEVEIGTCPAGNLRLHGGVHFGLFGCQVHYQGKRYEITWPAPSQK